MKTDIVRHITDATTSTATLTSGAIYSYVVTREFFMSLIIVGAFSIFGYLYNLVQDLKTENPAKLDIQLYIQIALRGFIISFFIATIVLIVCSYFNIEPAITLLASIILGARPEIFKNILTMAGFGIERIVKWWMTRNIK